ncbi:hypothetical protein QTP88_012130 [Uroleucon formosanum]
MIDLNKCIATYAESFVAAQQHPLPVDGYVFPAITDNNGHPSSDVKPFRFTFTRLYSCWTGCKRRWPAANAVQPRGLHHRNVKNFLNSSFPVGKVTSISKRIHVCAVLAALIGELRMTRFPQVFVCMCASAGHASTRSVSRMRVRSVHKRVRARARSSVSAVREGPSSRANPQSMCVRVHAASGQLE